VTVTLLSYPKKHKAKNMEVELLQYPTLNWLFKRSLNRLNQKKWIKITAQRKTEEITSSSKKT
jgi:hypothetical protein